MAYEAKEWKNGDKILSEDLNRMEEGIHTAQQIAGQLGPKGETGAQGPKGDTGEMGPQGPKGDTGETGPQGPKGDVGETGAQGPKGDDAVITPGRAVADCTAAEAAGVAASLNELLGVLREMNLIEKNSVE